MLGKLIKHELKASYKLILLAHAFLLITSIISGIFIHSMMNKQAIHEETLSFILIIAFLVLHFVLVGIISMGTLFYTGFRFYKGLFTDEGYLTFTLPTNPNTILHSRILTGGIWVIFDYIAIMIFVLIPCWPVITYPEIFIELIKIYSVPATIQVISFIINMIICLFSSVIMIYGCICIGQLLNKNRILTAIVSYGVMTVIIQIISTIYLFSKNLLMITDSTQQMINQSEATYSFNYFTDVMTFSGVLSLIFGIIFYIICRYIMNKKLNLI